MPMKPFRLFVCPALVILCLIGVRIAHATLGAPVESIESDRRMLSAVQGQTVERADYTVHEITRDGTAIREYVSPSGIVFAITWSGLRRPDLTGLLGSYNEQYQEALRKTVRQRGVRSLSVTADDVVVQQWGHVRDLRGKAYAPALVPAGVDINEIE